MKTYTSFILGLVLTLTVAAILINAEVACAILAALGVLAIAVNDYGPRRFTHSRLAV
jgi:hypothetical protein